MNYCNGIIYGSGSHRVLLIRYGSGTERNHQGRFYFLVLRETEAAEPEIPQTTPKMNIPNLVFKNYNLEITDYPRSLVQRFNNFSLLTKPVTK